MYPSFHINTCLTIGLLLVFILHALSLSLQLLEFLMALITQIQYCVLPLLCSFRHIWHVLFLRSTENKNDLYIYLWTWYIYVYKSNYVSQCSFVRTYTFNTALSYLTLKKLTFFASGVDCVLNFQTLTQIHTNHIRQLVTGLDWFNHSNFNVILLVHWLLKRRMGSVSFPQN